MSSKKNSDQYDLDFTLPATRADNEALRRHRPKGLVGDLREINRFSAVQLGLGTQRRDIFRGGKPFEL